MQEKMGPIMLDVDNHRLQEAWDEATQEIIEDYHNENKEDLIQLENNEFEYKKETWITKPPNSLLFTLNRVRYDKEK